MTRLVPFSFYRHFSSAFTLFTLLKIGGIRPLFVIVHFLFLKKEILAVWVGYSLRHTSDCPIPASKHTSKYFFEFQKITHHLLVHAHLVHTKFLCRNGTHLHPSSCRTEAPNLFINSTTRTTNQ